MGKTTSSPQALREAQMRLDNNARRIGAEKVSNRAKQVDIALQRAALEQKLGKLKLEVSQLSAEQAKQKHQAHALQLKTLEARLKADRAAWEKQNIDRPQTAKRMVNFTLQPKPKPEKWVRASSHARHPYGSDLGGLIDALSPFQDKTKDKAPPIRKSKVFAPATDTTPRDNTKWTRRADSERKRTQ